MTAFNTENEYVDRGERWNTMESHWDRNRKERERVKKEKHDIQ